MAKPKWKAVPCQCGWQGCTSFQVPAVLPFEAHLSEENARLIAAAPELLEALEGLIGVMADLINLYDSETCRWIQGRGSYEKGVAAIKKAKGEL